MTRHETYKFLAEKAGVTPVDAKAVIEAIPDLIVAVCQQGNALNLGGLMKFTVQTKAAQPAREGINPFTKQPTTIQARPASRKLKLVALKPLKDAIGS